MLIFQGFEETKYLKFAHNCQTQELMKFQVRIFIFKNVFGERGDK